MAVRYQIVETITYKDKSVTGPAVIWNEEKQKFLKFIFNSYEEAEKWVRHLEDKTKNAGFYYDIIKVGE